MDNVSKDKLILVQKNIICIFYELFEGAMHTHIHIQAYTQCKVYLTVIHNYSKIFRFNSQSLEHAAHYDVIYIGCSVHLSSQREVITVSQWTNVKK